MLNNLLILVYALSSEGLFQIELNNWNKNNLE